MDSNHYIWRSVRDENSRSEHAKRHGEIFSWDNPPKDGHPGEAPNCRCWAEPLQKNDCEGFLKEIRVLEDEMNKQTSRLNKLNLHNENLIRDNNELVNNMQLQLGYNIAAHIIDYPFKKIPLLAEMIRERFGGLVGEAILNKADQMSKELHAIRERKHYNDEQIELLEHGMTQLEQNREKLQKLYQHCIEEPSIHV